MKTRFPNHRRPHEQAAFALVITMVMMSLTVVLCLALLALAAGAGGSARSNRQMAQAQSNARLSLMVAVGQLQKLAGPDRRVTATAEIKDAKGQPHLTGVWESTRLNSAKPAVTDKDSLFRGWLGSDPQPKRLADPKYAVSAPADENSVLMLGKGTLGQKADAQMMMRAPLVPVDSSSVKSPEGRPRLAWSVMDEGVKARLDLVDKNLKNPIAQGQGALGCAPRYAMEAVSDLGGSYEWWKGQNLEKVSSLKDVALLAPGTEAGLRTHDVTTWSRGVLASVNGTGTMRDLSLVFDVKNAASGTTAGTAPTNLPAPFADGIYIDPAIPRKANKSSLNSNPNWSQVAAYSQIYNKLQKSSVGDYQVTASTPSQNYLPSDLLPPEGQPLIPAVAKVQMVFSLVTRMAHGGWPSTLQTNRGGPPNDGDAYWKMLHMLYSPVITVYNPYNVALSFNKLQLDFVDVPIGFRFFVNGVAQTNDIAPLNMLYVYRESTIRNKTFSITLQGDLNSSSTPVVLAPGETRVFGAFLPETWRWVDESPGTGTDGNKFFDWRDSDAGGTASTSGVTCAQGWVPGIGFDIDWLAPAGAGRTNGYSHGVIGLKRTDQVDVEFAPLQPTASTTASFATRISVVDASGTLREAGRLELAYDSTNTLRASLNQVDTAGFGKVTYPTSMGALMKNAGGWPKLCWEIYQDANDMVKDYGKGNPMGGLGAKAFAIFTFSGKTTIDAGFPTRPWVVSNPATTTVKMDLKKEHQGIHPYEFVLQPVGSGGAGVAGSVELDEFDRGYYFTSHSALLGLQAAPHYELPILPLQSVAQLRHANLADSGQLPAVDYTVGESFAHPLFQPNAVRAPAPAGSYQLYDHTWFANNQLWDNYFFSTFNTYDGLAFTAGTKRSLDQVVTDFFTGKGTILNSRYVPYVPPGRDPATVAAELKTNTGYQRSGAYLMSDGSFNINSTSVEAWKALLRSLSHRDVAFFDPMGSASLTPQAGVVKDAMNLVARFRRPAGDSLENKKGVTGLPWRGCRTLTDKQIDRLAEEIVKEVKLRGPFISLGEFVNRRPGTDTDLALRGALQAAIEHSGINEIFNDNTLGRPVTNDMINNYGLAFPQAITGWNAVAAPGYITQGDLLTAVGPYVSARSDTFRVRAYGDVRDTTGHVVSRAWCEAVVQRTPDYVLADETEDGNAANGNAAWEAQVKDNGEDNPACAAVNKAFGRRFRIVNFRWLTPDEV